MGAAAAPMLIGSAIGAVSSKNPLQGALLGGALGGAGGAFMSGGGLSSMLPSLGSSATPAALSSSVLPSTGGGFAGGGFGSIGAAPPFNPAAIFANPTAAISGVNLGGGPSSGLINASTAPSFMENIGTGLEGIGQYTQQNPVLTQMGLQSAQQMMQQPQAQMAPAGQVSRGQIQGGDYMSLLNPQQGSVIRPQPISLLG